MTKAMCRAQLNDRKTSKDLMLMMGLKETMDQLAMGNNVCWYGHVLRTEDGHVLRRALDILIEGQRKKGMLKRTYISVTSTIPLLFCCRLYRQ